MKSYYRDRAPVYDRVYSYPERQRDLRCLEHYIPLQLAGRRVLEIAAGTGYWTQFIARSAQSVVATDAVPEALELAKRRPGIARVSFQIADAYHLNQIEGPFDGVFAGLWYSHVPKERVREFLLSFHRLIAPGTTVIFLDNSKAQCSRLPIGFMDEQGNSYQERALDDGSLHKVLKNFPSKRELCEATGEFALEQHYIELENFWLFQYLTR